MYHRPYCKGLNIKKMSFSEYIRHYYNYNNEEADNIIKLRTKKITLGL